MKKFAEYLVEEINQETINKKQEELRDLTDEKDIIKLKSEIELMQQKLSNK